MRNYEDGYFDGENAFFEDFSVYPTAPAASQFAVMPQQAAPQFAAMPQPAAPQQAAPAFDEYDDYTGRMGPDGEPERYSTMRGGDPRVRQQRELAERERRLQGSFSIDNWLKSGNKDVRGTTAASQITLNPGTQYRIRDYSGGKGGQIIASGSTPEEFLMMQDIARGLARQGTNADYRLEQIGGEAAENFGQYRDPATGEAVSIIGGDLYNKPIGGEIFKIALPIALQFLPGLGTALGANLGLSGLAAKAAGVGLTSALGRTGAGILTGENVGDALKAGAIGGVASGATAGLLGATGVDKAIGSAFGGAKGALAGEAAGQGVAQGVGQAAASLPGEIVVSAARNALPSVLSGGLSAAGGSLLGEVGQSLARPDQFQQALEQAQMQNQFAPTTPPMAPEDILEVVGQRGTGAVPGAGALAGAAPPLLDSTLSDIIRQYEPPQQMAETPAEDEIVVSNTATPDVDLSGPPALAPGIISGLTSGALSTGINSLAPNSFSQAMDQARLDNQFGPAPTDLGDEIVVSGGRIPAASANLSGIAAAPISTGVSSILQQMPAAPSEQIQEAPADEEIEVATQRPVDLGLTPSLGGGVANIGADLAQSTLNDILQRYEPPVEEYPEQVVEQQRPQDFPSPLYVPPMETLPIFDAPFTGADMLPPVEEEMQTVTQQRPQEPRGTLTAPITLPDGTLDFGDVVPEESASARRPEEIPPFTLDVPPVPPLPTFEPPFTGVETAVPGEDPEQVVTGKKEPPAAFPPTTLTFPDAPFVVPPTTIPPFEAPPTVEAPKKGSIIPKVIGGLSLLDLLSKALAGSGGGGATGGAGRLNPIFSAQLPGASPAFSQQSLAPRPGGVSGPAMSDIDWYRYGYYPERSFFNYVPATEAEREAMMVAPPPRGASPTLYNPLPSLRSTPGVFQGKTVTDVMRNLSPGASDAEIQEYLATPEGQIVLQQIMGGMQPQFEMRARGGALAVKKGGAPAKESFAVKGPGTGRSDEIPALLSDGEYVIDAETVALLGDGSSEAGAKRLDDFRVNIRKHKGQNLARGKFSANAKRPEKYLSGGRV